MTSKQDKAFAKVAHLPYTEIVCKVCGEGTAKNSMMGYVHKYGPTTHTFIATRKED